jgi:beta-glucosidase
MSERALPTPFLWGAATSAFQIEGAATEDGRGESIWDRYCRQPGAIADGSDGAVACDHVHRVREDLGLARELGLTAYRFSVAWPRVLPDGDGAVNARGLDFYDRLVDGCLEHGLRPMLTLYHWDLPQALQERGGWASRDIVGWFERYTDVVTRRPCARRTWWATRRPRLQSLRPGACTPCTWPSTAMHHGSLSVTQSFTRSPRRRVTTSV